MDIDRDTETNEDIYLLILIERERERECKRDRDRQLAREREREGKRAGESQGRKAGGERGGGRERERKNGTGARRRNRQTATHTRTHATCRFVGSAWRLRVRVHLRHGQHFLTVAESKHDSINGMSALGPSPPRATWDRRHSTNDMHRDTVPRDDQTHPPHAAACRLERQVHLTLGAGHWPTVGDCP